MNRNIRENRPKNYLVFVVLIYLVAGISILKYYRYQINPDGISYISIAQKYLNGDFSNAVNGWWGPLLSWLLMPFLCFSSDALLAGKILTLFTGIVAFIALWTLSYRFDITESIRKAILFSAIPVILSFAFSDLTPDLLLTTMLLFYFAVIFGGNYVERTNKGILCGVLGGFAYLTKSYAFPFFISHFLIMNVLHYFRAETRQIKKRVVQNFLTGAVVFALISGVWIGLLSNKYGEPTFGTAGRAAYAAKVIPSTEGGAVRWQGFLEPPNETAMSAWEDSSLVEIEGGSPMSFGELLSNQFRVTSRLIKEEAKIFMDFSVLSVAIGIAYVLFWLQRFNKAALTPEVLYPTVTIVLFAGGYSLVTVNARYLWLICLVLMLMGGYVLARLFQNKFFTKTRRAALLIIFFLSFAVPASHDLRDYAHRGKWVYNLGQALKNAIPAKSKIASNSNWAGSLFLSYHLDCKYYGAQKKNIGKIELKRQLEKYGIDYYLFWGGGASDLSFLSDYREITGGRIPGLGVYSLRKNR